MTSAINVSVEKGFLRIIGEIPVASTKEELEAFISDINWRLLGDKETQKAPSFGLLRRELTEADAAIYIGRSRSFLRSCRHEGKKGKRPRGPKYTRDSERSIRYPVEELDKWLASRALYEASCEEMSDGVE
ncbi:hypothetical protein LJC31_07460 [Synergistaceae bacterium OttesenSCG-928-I11]|nr:hypothetical protein [Synergistaceae bacterium OttesenSCG-928-I11]